MIKVYIEKKEDRVSHMMVTGHAAYDEPGKDIVCSAVSALTIGAINSVEILLQIDLQPKQRPDQGGYLSWDIPLIADDQTDDRLQLLMKALMESLLMIEQEYSEYIKITVE